MPVRLIAINSLGSDKALKPESDLFLFDPHYFILIVLSL